MFSHASSQVVILSVQHDLYFIIPETQVFLLCILYIHILQTPINVFSTEDFWTVSQTQHCHTALMSKNDKPLFCSPTAH